MAMGRPREFDVEEALDRALKVFWQKGYEGTSISDLTAAMGINRPSLYAAFGNKEALYRRVLDRYAEGPAGYIRKALQAPTARAVVEQLWRGAVEALTSPCNPAGCLAVQGALSCPNAAAIQQEIMARRAAAEIELRKRLERAIGEADLPADSDPAGLARYVATVVQGMSVQAAAGATRKDLEQVVDTALRGWPAPPRKSRPKRKAS